MRAVIPVAGVGTRLRPHTYSLPKVLLNVAGKPMISHILDALFEHNVTKVTIITGYMSEEIEEFIHKNYGNLQIDFVKQEERLGLGHAIWTGKETYKADEPLIIILGDTIFDVDLSVALKSEVSSIGIKQVEDPRRFGVVVLDENRKINNDKIIQKFVEKPVDFVSDLAIVGMYFIKKSENLVKSLNNLIENDIRTRGEYQLTDALELMLKAGEIFTTFPVEGWYDCGKRETLLSTNKILLEKYYSIQNKFNQKEFKQNVIIPPCFISENAEVENSVIGPYVSISDGAFVRDSIIKNSIINNDAKVENSLLSESIIGYESEVKGKFSEYNLGSSSTIELE
jgi:glucose-1-phosphate thymidylyltransferase